ncbi:DEAD/DEAH box helicase [Aquimarina hainanensis]|uniref:DEAD/DEAH box helicase n=1 Tax=Aquimarina hainanensis TaxID=1578017 RepID=A0ABW5N7E9_9FLAO
MDSFCICYNLVDLEYADVPPLPEAYIATISNQKIGYIEKQALPEILDTYKIPYLDTTHARLLEICQALKPSELTLRFQAKKRKKNYTIAELLTDKKTKEVLLQYIHRKMSTFYTLLSENRFPLCYNAKRKDHLAPYMITHQSTALTPLLTFAKKEQGIEYSFSIKKEDRQLQPKDHDIRILLNNPAWIILDKQLAAIEHLNANKLKPFFKKNTISIEEKHVRTYLDKIILPVIQKIEVITEGFDIITHQEVTSYELIISHDFIRDLYVGTINYQYNQVSFRQNDTKTSTSDVLINENNHIQIIQTKRNTEQESKIGQLLIEKGLSLSSNLVYELVEEKDPYAIMTWLGNYQRQLEKEGFKLPEIHIQGKKIHSGTPSISIENTQQNDWFDIKGVISIGHHNFPFTDLIQHIKQNNRVFTIDDNTAFIIPLEWMNRYKKLAIHGRASKNALSVNKSNYPLLRDIIPAAEFTIEETSLVYSPSSKLKATLRPYQEEGVKWLIEHYNKKLGACLADDMGLGKTLQTIAVLTFIKEQLIPEENSVQKIQFDLFSSPLEIKTYLKALIVLPSSLVFNWAQEIIKFAPHLNCVKYTGADRKKITPYVESYDIVLSTYTTISKDIEQLKKFQFNYLIIDESQQIKNKESKLFSAINSIQTINKISLSGTPIENSLADLWSQMEFINPGILGSYSFFKNHFRIPIEKHQDTEKIEELKELINPFILRRTKEQVAKDLPEVSEQIIYTEMLPLQEKQYESEKSAARNLLLGIDNPSTNKIHIINTLTKLRQLANHPALISPETEEISGKFTDVTNYLMTLVKANKKVLVFSSFVSHLDIYTSWCSQNQISYCVLTGQTKSSDREQIVNTFQEDDHLSIFFISLKAGGVGLNLTKASYVVLLDPWWNPFIEKQAIARAHRIGQTKNVTVSRFITKNTIEEKIIQLQNKKKSLSDDIIMTEGLPDYIENDLESILK